MQPETEAFRAEDDDDVDAMSLSALRSK